MTNPAIALVEAKLATLPQPNSLTRTSDDGRTVVVIVPQGKKATPYLRVEHDGALVYGALCRPLVDSARDAFVQKCPPDLQPFVASALTHLSDTWAALQSKSVPSQREAEQSRMTIDTEPWVEPVNLAEVLDACRREIERYCVLPPHAAAIVTLYVALTYWVEALTWLPYLLAESPMMRCGKTRLLELIECLARRAWAVSSLSGPAVFRVIEAERPCLIVDEIDTLSFEKVNDLASLFNDGWKRTGKAVRCDGENNAAKTFSVFCFKVMAGIGANLKPATRDRCIRIAMTRATKRETQGLANWDPSRAEAWALPLRRQLARASVDYFDELRDMLYGGETTPATRLGLYAREGVVWAPLLAVADIAGGHWPSTAAAAAVASVEANKADADDERERLLRDLRTYFEEPEQDRTIFRDTAKATSEQLITWLIEDESRGWKEYRGRDLTPHTLARLLKPFGLKPERIREGKDRAYYWHRSKMTPLWEKYLPVDPPDQSGTSGTVGHVRPRVPLVPDSNGERGSHTSKDDWTMTAPSDSPIIDHGPPPDATVVPMRGPQRIDDPGYWLSLEHDAA